MLVESVTPEEVKLVTSEVLEGHIGVAQAL
jgi:hypothetical protein